MTSKLNRCNILSAGLTSTENSFFHFLDVDSQKIILPILDVDLLELRNKFDLFNNVQHFCYLKSFVLISVHLDFSRIFHYI